MSYFVAGEMERMWGDAEGLVQDAEAAARSGTHADEGSTVIGGDEGVDDWESFVRDYAAAELQRLWEAAELRCCTHRADAADQAAVVVGPVVVEVDECVDAPVPRGAHAQVVEIGMDLEQAARARQVHAAPFVARVGV